MAGSNQQRWYPTPDHPRQDTDRIIFDNLYQLRDEQNNGASAQAQTQQGMSVTVSFKDSNNNAVSVVAGGKTFSSLTFANGLLQGVS